MNEAEKKPVDEHISQHNASWTFDNISGSFDGSWWPAVA